MDRLSEHQNVWIAHGRETRRGRDKIWPWEAVSALRDRT
ncbi:hypothetical protein BN903_44 [Halorubrum sp. AJ67]|nr:hypothetical protein BN903_44 [Halorubrum sp. AJ67]